MVRSRSLTQFCPASDLPVDSPPSFLLPFLFVQRLGFEIIEEDLSQKGPIEAERSEQQVDKSALEK